MDLSPPSSMIVIAPLRLMIPNVFPQQMDVRTLASPDSIDTCLTGYQGDQRIHFL